ncbi:CYFA0S21e00518g1_1 [Cyberlindnera fabianii]|uniref:Efficient mitochondria targeting-associated protein 19 n=1 Tax=Cyberlindnera fabianii TaxID=36022 RepID=A0A061B7W1_CYBFA|nr:CYFA0S21e00518g1_1 [Cyberlindnera fabianii]
MLQLTTDSTPSIMTRFYSTQKLFTSSTKLDTFYFCYCLLHIPITVLIDSALVIPTQWQPSFQKAIIEFHTSSNNDYLLLSPPDWLVVFGWVEILFQLPLFGYAALQLYKRSPTIYPLLFVYGVEAAVTTLCCLLHIVSEGGNHGLTQMEVINLFGVYLPTFVIPLFMAIDVFTREWNSPVNEKKRD